MGADHRADAARDILVHLSGEDLERVRAAAARRGMDIDDLLVEAVRVQLAPITSRAAVAAALGEHIRPAPMERFSPAAQVLVRIAGELVRLGWSAAGRGRYSIARGLATNGRLRMTGPGRIRVGHDLNAWAWTGMNLIATYRREAMITIGDGVRLNGAAIHAAARVDVGDGVILGGSSILDTDHHAVEPRDRRTGVVRTRPVRIGKGVWVGGSVVLKGVSIGDGSVVEPGSVVTADVPPGVVVSGNPARVVRRLEV